MPYCIGDGFHSGCPRKAGCHPVEEDACRRLELLRKAEAELTSLREIKRLAKEYRAKVLEYRSIKDEGPPAKPCSVKYSDLCKWEDKLQDAWIAKREAGEALFAALGNEADK